MPWLINAAQLDKLRKDQKNVIVFDASWHLPEANRDPLSEFQEKHVIGAKFFDITSFNDNNTSLPNMLTRDENFIAEKLGELGVTNEHKIIFYDNSELHSTCRAIWMLKVFGHLSAQLYLLDGGFQSWMKYGGKLEKGPAKESKPREYQVNYQPPLVRTLMQMKANYHHPLAQVIDMRHALRFAGGGEHRPKMRSGHIPQSTSFPYMSMFTKEGILKPVDKIKQLLLGISINMNQPIITMCGSGITASILNFALDLMNHSDHSLYDGSWAEWGSSMLYQGESSLEERPVISSLDIPFSDFR